LSGHRCLDRRAWLSTRLDNRRHLAAATPGVDVGALGAHITAKADHLGERRTTIATIAPLWTIKDVSEFLGIPVQTLYQWRHRHSGPPAYRVGRHLRYDPTAVLAWLEDAHREAG
jgi:excisionase family DNA binding protein